jgi:hypothetical protein
MAMAVDYIGRASGRSIAQCPSREREAQLGGIVERLLQEYDQLVTDADGIKRAITETGEPAPIVSPPPLVEGGVDSELRAQRLRTIEAAVLRTFGDRRTTRHLTQSVLDALEYSHADVVRALEDLEKQRGLIVRRTEEGNDWLALTEPGTRAAGVENAPRLGPL